MRVFDVTTPDGLRERVYLEGTWLLTQEELDDIDAPARYALRVCVEHDECTCEFDVWLSDSKERRDPEVYSWHFSEQCGYTITEVIENL